MEKPIQTVQKLRPTVKAGAVVSHIMEKYGLNRELSPEERKAMDQKSQEWDRLQEIERIAWFEGAAGMPHTAGRVPLDVCQQCSTWNNVFAWLCGQFGPAVDSCKPRLIVLAGLPGTGKTEMGCFFLKRMIRHHKASARYELAPVLLHLLNEGRRFDARLSTADIIDYVVGFKVAVFDELPCVAADSPVNNSLRVILQMRLAAGKHSVITVDTDSESARGHLGRDITTMAERHGGIISCSWTQEDIQENRRKHQVNHTTTSDS